MQTIYVGNCEPKIPCECSVKKQYGFPFVFIEEEEDSGWRHTIPGTEKSYCVDFHYKSWSKININAVLGFVGDLIVLLILVSSPMSLAIFWKKINSKKTFNKKNHKSLQ